MTKSGKGTTAVKSSAPKAGKTKAVAVRRDPTAEEAESNAAARAARSERKKRIRPPALETIFQGPGALGISSPHSDMEGWGIQMMEAFGVDSYGVVERLMVGAGQVAPQKAVNCQADADEAQSRSNVALSFVAALEPKSTLEATLALQMLASHEASMKMSAHLHNATTRDGLTDYARMMNQTMRTFAAQVEALSKLRTGGKQQVEVRYVYVDARTQTVVNAGGGGRGRRTNQRTTPCTPSPRSCGCGGPADVARARGRGRLASLLRSRGSGVAGCTAASPPERLPAKRTATTVRAAGRKRR